MRVLALTIPTADQNGDTAKTLAAVGGLLGGAWAVLSRWLRRRRDARAKRDRFLDFAFTRSKAPAGDTAREPAANAADSKAGGTPRTEVHVVHRTSFGVREIGGREETTEVRSRSRQVFDSSPSV